MNNQEAHLNAVFSGHKLRESAYPRLVMRNQASFLAPSKRNAPPHCVTESMRLPLVILAFACLLSQLPAEENWPQFRDYADQWLKENGGIKTILYLQPERQHHERESP